jgi:hypothetical protein
VQPTSATKLYPSTAAAAANQPHTASSGGFRSKRNSAANQRLRYLNEQTAQANGSSHNVATNSSNSVIAIQQANAGRNNANTAAAAVGT